MPDVEFQLLHVYVWDKNHNNYVTAIALIDGGSNASLCTENLYNKLGLSGKQANIRMKTLDSTVRDITTKRTSFTVKGTQACSVTKHLNNVLVVQSLPDSCHRYGKCDYETPIFEGLPDFPTISGTHDIDILIGACDPDQHIMLDCLHHKQH